MKRALQSRPEGQAERDAVPQVLAALSQPADPVRIMARVGALLEPYYDKGTPRSIREIEMEDWADALEEYPYWAIERAAKWWKSADNPDRRKRPIEGDIVARCKVETMVIRACKMAGGKPVLARSSVNEDRKPVSRERAAEIMREAGFQPKRFPSVGEAAQ